MRGQANVEEWSFGAYLTQSSLRVIHSFTYTARVGQSVTCHPLDGSTPLLTWPGHRSDISGVDMIDAAYG